jgi:hypothetical protein
VGRSAQRGNLKVEHFARSVSAHLLDAGFASQDLHDFVKARLDAPDPITAAELCDELHTAMVGLFVLFVLNLAVFPSEADFANCHGI